MNESQYRQVLKNAGGRRAAQLLADGVGPRLLRSAARSVRLLEAAGALWEELAPPDVLGGTRVLAVEDGTIVIAVVDRGVCETLARSAAGWAGEFARVLPAVRRVRFVRARGIERE